MLPWSIEDSWASKVGHQVCRSAKLKLYQQGGEIRVCSRKSPFFMVFSSLNYWLTVDNYNLRNKYLQHYQACSAIHKIQHNIFKLFWKAGFSSLYSNASFLRTLFVI